MKNSIKLALVMCLAGAGWAVAGDHPMPAGPAPSKEFQQLQQLVGTWKGSEIGSDASMPDITVQYKLTAGGSALTELLDEGKPHEMLTVYTDEGGKLGMTHYSMLGNHPRMKLVKSDAHELAFEMKDRGAIAPKDMHMHALVLYLQDSDHLMQKWTSYADGKESKVSTFKLERVKS